MRSSNPIDFWRGYALVVIFVDHIPGLSLAGWTHGQWGVSDAAELFVFLAGWALRLAVGRRDSPERAPRMVLRLFERSVSIYVAQLFISISAVGMIAGAALLFDNPLLIELNNAAAVFYEPIAGHLGLVILSHHLGFFDILPLYVVLMMVAPAIALIDRLSTALLFLLSLALYAATLVYGLGMPTWPVEGTWFFSPFAWQFIFVLGFIAAKLTDMPQLRRGLVHTLRIPATMVVIAAFVAAGIYHWSPDPIHVPEPRLLFLFDKTHLSPARILHFLCLVVAVSGLFDIVARRAGWLARGASALGRNSLRVFCMGSLASLAGQLVRYGLGSSLIVDIAVVTIGTILLVVTAWLSEWRNRPVSGSSSPRG